MNIALVDILLIEDNPGDVLLIQQALRDNKIRIRLHVVHDGEAGLQFLHAEGAYRAAVRPDLILLDLNLPRKDGRQVLAEVKADPNLRSIPIVVLTSSHAEEDIARAYNLNANCYVQKPLDLEQFNKVVHSIENFWFTIVNLPPSPNP